MDIYIILRLAWIVAILLGFMYAVSKILKLQVYFVPIFTLSLISVVVYCSGIIGKLQSCCYLLFIVGSFLFLYAVFFDFRPKLFIKSIPISSVCVLIGFLVFARLIIDTKLIHYDNYSHWLTVVKEILMTDKFPDKNSVIVEFLNYPLGMASFIYFVCSIVGNTQGIMLIAQAMLIFACFSSFFAIIQDKKRVLLTLILATGLAILSFLNITIRINNLLVDFLLPLLALSAISVIYVYRENFNKLLITITPILGLLVIVKNTGVIFAFFAVFYLIYVSITHMKVNKFAIIKVFATLLLSFSTIIVWNFHVNQVFYDVEHKFDIQLTYEIADKTFEQAREICVMFFKTFTDFSLRPTIALWFFEIATVLACVIGCIILQKKWNLVKVFIVCNIFLALYYIGILAMYLYSMPLMEAEYLAGFDRYSSSIMVLFSGVLIMCFVIDIQNSFYYKVGQVEDYKAFYSIETKQIYNISCIFCMAITFMILTSEYSGMAYTNTYVNQSIPAKLQEIVGDNWQEVNENAYLLYSTDEDDEVSNYYLYHTGKYYLWSAKVGITSNLSEDMLDSIVNYYDYLIIVRSDATQKEFMMQYFGIEADEGIYKISDIKNTP